MSSIIIASIRAGIDYLDGDCEYLDHLDQEVGSKVLKAMPHALCKAADQLACKLRDAGSPAA